MITKIRILAGAAILAAALCLPPGMASAQTPVHLSQLTIRLWPEFDRSGVLAFFVGHTADDVALPAELKFTLPPNATVNAVAYIDAASGGPSDDLPHNIDGSTISLTTPNGSFHIEFYDPALVIEKQQRSYRFTWQANYTIDQLSWEVQHPAGATNFKVEPQGGSTITDDNGLATYQLGTGGLAAGQAATIVVSYGKQTDTFTIDTLRGGGTAASTAPQPAGNSTLIIIGAVVLAALIVSGVVVAMCGGFAGISRRLAGAPAQEVRERKPRGRAAKKLGKKPPPGQRFCPQCGQAALPGDLFCRSCGTKLHG